MLDCVSRNELQKIGSSASPRKHFGFTLIELMIVVGIVAILAAIAMPSYTRYLFRTRRTEGKEMLMRVAAAQERYYTNFNRYASVMGAAANGLGFTAPAGAGCAAGDSANCYYNVTIGGLGGTNQTYTLTGTPKLLQLGDSCGALTLTNAGVKAAPSDNGRNGKCW